MKKKYKAKRFMKMLLLYSSIVIFMDLVGVGYSQWSDNINVESILKTGSVKVDFGTSFGNGVPMNIMNGKNSIMNTNINFDAGTPGEEYFEFKNNGTLPVSINFDRFNPIVEVMAGETPLVATIIIDPILYNCIEPGSTVCGKIHVEVPNEYIKNNMLSNINEALIGNDAATIGPDMSNIVYSNNGVPLNVVNSTITECQNIVFKIPVGCGGWEELLQLNVAVNVSRHVSSILPDITGMGQNYLNNNGGVFGYTYLPDGNNTDNSYTFGENTDYTYLPNGNSSSNSEENVGK